MENKRNTPFIEVRNLKKYYPIKGGIITHTTGVIKAVDDVSFVINRGEVLGLVGESGSGKSTIGKQLVGLEKPTEGMILYNGEKLETLSNRGRVQMIFQDPYSSLNPRKHIYEILSQPMLYHKMVTKQSVEKELERLLDLVGLPKSVLGRYPGEFSGGQRQRIAIAKALSLQPEFIVCDEPVSALDVSIQAQILNLLNDLRQELDLTLLFIAHGLGAVRYVSDRIAVMHQGKIVECRDADDIFDSPEHEYTKKLLAAVPDIPFRMPVDSGEVQNG